ncbi:MAG: type IV pilin protein [Burkholderiaceae bacterium]
MHQLPFTTTYSTVAAGTASAVSPRVRSTRRIDLRRGKAQGGFTLIEVMITIAIIAILTAIALPAYRNYIIRGKLVAGTNALANMRAQMEQYYQDNRTYATVSAPRIVSPCVANAVTASGSNPFDVGCSAAADAPTSTTYTLRATGTGVVAGSVYTIDQGNNMTTAGFPTPWGSVPPNNGCWIMRKGDSC